jgi:protein associated with RNAse G/E
MITVYKLDHQGNYVWHYPAVVLERHSATIKLEAFFNRDDMELRHTTFKRGDRFIEYYYGDRWYNVFAVYDRDDGRLKGWYCNICRPALIGETAVLCEDLALDLWIAPDSPISVLDEDEFVALPLADEERACGEAAVQHLLRLAQHSQLPT